MGLLEDWMETGMDSNQCQETLVRLSGIMLSSLIEGKLQSGDDQEGFLFGQSTVNTIQVNSDSESDSERKQRVVTIIDFLASERVGGFYNGAGQLLSSQLPALLDRGEGVRIVGWFRCRAGPSQPFLRERTVHRRLSQMLPGMVLLLITEFVQELHAIRHQPSALVLSASADRLVEAQLQVANIGETPPPVYRSAAYSSLGLLLPAAEQSSDGGAALATAVAAQSSAHENLRKLLHRLTESERDVADAYREMRQLELRLAAERGSPEP